MAWYLAPSLAQLRTEIDALWPGRDRTSDGSVGDTSHLARKSDHNPDYSAGGIVRAVDIDEDLIAGLTAAGEAMPLVEQIIRDRRVAYVVYEGRIWQSPAVFARGGWQAYSGVNAHRHHVHVSVRWVAFYDSDRRPWGIAEAVSQVLAPRPAPLTPRPALPPPAPLASLEEESDMKDRLIALYLKNVGRLPDPVGFTAYASLVTLSGWTWQQVDEDLRRSPEAVAFAALGSEAARNAVRAASGWSAS